MVDLAILLEQEGSRFNCLLFGERRSTKTMWFDKGTGEIYSIGPNAPFDDSIDQKTLTRAQFYWDASGPLTEVKDIECPLLASGLTSVYDQIDMYRQTFRQ